MWVPQKATQSNMFFPQSKMGVKRFFRLGGRKGQKKPPPHLTLCHGGHIEAMYPLLHSPLLSESDGPGQEASTTKAHQPLGKVLSRWGSPTTPPTACQWACCACTVPQYVVSITHQGGGKGGVAR